jgi:hypothetical protein
MIYNWTEPIPTKSGRLVKDIWNELQECWQNYKTAVLNDDLLTQKVNAKRIQELQDDLGLTVTPFVILDGDLGEQK